MPTYDYEDRDEIETSCFMIHNFIRLNQVYENEIDLWDEKENYDNGKLLHVEFGMNINKCLAVAASAYPIQNHYCLENLVLAF
jgi:hypothetical protein